MEPTKNCHVYDLKTNICTFCFQTPDEVANNKPPEAPPTTVVKRLSDCIAATVNGTIVTVADEYDLGYIFALIFAVCQYREIKLVDADIKFYRANGNPGLAPSLQEAVSMWNEDPGLLDFFNHADVPDILDINNIFQLFEEFSETIRNYSLQEIYGDSFEFKFPEGDSGGRDESPTEVAV